MENEKRFHVSVSVDDQIHGFKVTTDTEEEACSIGVDKAAQKFPQANEIFAVACEVLS